MVIKSRSRFKFHCDLLRKNYIYRVTVITKKRMERVFSIAEITEQYWLTSKACKEGESKMNRSDSEWAFQQFLQQQQQQEPASTSHAKPSSSSSTSTSSSNVDLKLNINNNNNNDNNINDSEDYHAFLKTKLELACAAFAMSRVYIYLFLYNSIEFE